MIKNWYKTYTWPVRALVVQYVTLYHYIAVWQKFKIMNIFANPYIEFCKSFYYTINDNKSFYYTINDNNSKTIT